MSSKAPASAGSDSEGSDGDVDTPTAPDPVLVRPFATNPHWADLEPVKQDDGPDPVVPIAYKPEFVDVMNYFRAILKKNELSERALKLTREVIYGNAANYTAWHFRRLCMLHLNSDIPAELKWVERLAMSSPKNYQLWHHRRVLLTELGSPLQDLLHTERVLQLDGKNYHVWSHRQWLLQHFALWETQNHSELAFTDKLIAHDVRNNSAWNQRHFVHTHYWGQPLQPHPTPKAAAVAPAAAAVPAPAPTPAGAGVAAAAAGAGGADGPWSAATITAEIKYAADRIAKVPNNESPWNYLEGMLKKPHYSAAVHGAALLAVAEAVLHADPTCRFACSLQLEVYERGAEGSPARYADAARKVATALAEKLDPVRHKYWLWRRDTFGAAVPPPLPPATHATAVAAVAAAGGAAPAAAAGVGAGAAPAAVSKK